MMIERPSLPPLRRRVFAGRGASVPRGAIAFAAARNVPLIASMPAASGDAPPVLLVRGWSLIPPAGASPVAGLSRVPVTSLKPVRDALLGFRPMRRERRFFGGLAVGHLAILGGCALPRVAVFALRPDLGLRRL